MNDQRINIKVAFSDEQIIAYIAYTFKENVQIHCLQLFNIWLSCFSLFFNDVSYFTINSRVKSHPSRFITHR